MDPSIPDSLVVETAVFGTFFLVLTGGTILFALRAIRLIEADGRADRKTVWRLALLRFLAAIAGVSGGLTVILAFATILGELYGMLSLSALWNSPRLRDQLLFTMTPILIFGIAYWGIAIAIGNYGSRVWRSFTVLRGLTAMMSDASMAFRRWSPVAAVAAFVQKYDRPLW